MLILRYLVLWMLNNKAITHNNSIFLILSFFNAHAAIKSIIINIGSICASVIVYRIGTRASRNGCCIPLFTKTNMPIYCFLQVIYILPYGGYVIYLLRFFLNNKYMFPNQSRSFKIPFLLTILSIPEFFIILKHIGQGSASSISTQAPSSYISPAR